MFFGKLRLPDVDLWRGVKQPTENPKCQITSDYLVRNWDRNLQNIEKNTPRREPIPFSVSKILGITSMSSKNFKLNLKEGKTLLNRILIKYLSEWRVHF